MAAATAYRAAEWLVFPLHLANRRATGDVRELDHWEQLWPLGCTDTSNKKFTTVLSTEALFETAILFSLWISSVLMLARHFFFLKETASWSLHVSLLCRKSHVPALLLRSFFIPLSTKERAAGRGAGGQGGFHIILKVQDRPLVACGFLNLCFLPSCNKNGMPG